MCPFCIQISLKIPKAGSALRSDLSLASGASQSLHQWVLWKPCGADVIARLDPLYSTRLRSRLRSLKRALPPLAMKTQSIALIVPRCTS